MAIRVAHDFGSVAGEVAVCLRAVGIADRSDLVKLDISGNIAGLVPSTEPGRCYHLRRAWWSVVSPRHVFVLVDPSHAARLADELGPLTSADVSDDWGVIAVIGPRAEALMRAAGAPRPFPGAVVEGQIAGAEVVLVRDTDQEFLISVPPAAIGQVHAALREAGRDLGAASVGREAHERFEIAAGIRRSRVDHSGW